MISLTRLLRSQIILMGLVEQLIKQSVSDACAEVQQNNIQMTNGKAQEITDSIYQKTYEILEGQGD